MANDKVIIYCDECNEEILLSKRNPKDDKIYVHADQIELAQWLNDHKDCCLYLNTDRG